MGRIISRKYEELGQLGQGGMGVVYKVRHKTLDTIHALKVLPAYMMENQDMVDRFYREARVMALLNHPNIVKVIDIDHDAEQDLYYFVMEYVQGRMLKQDIQSRGPLPLLEALEICCQIARALIYAHRQTPPVIHRDIKPANIMIEEPSQRVVVLDFGIAKQLEAASHSTRAGTPRYCAPEQLLGKAISGNVDVYSLGLVLYEMIAGKQFFAGIDENTILAQALDMSREYNVTFSRPVPAELTAIIRKAIKKSPEQRYATMLDFIQDLEVQRKVLREPVTVVDTTPQPDPPKPVVVEQATSEAKNSANKPKGVAGDRPIEPDLSLDCPDSFVSVSGPPVVDRPIDPEPSSVRPQPPDPYPTSEKINQAWGSKPAPTSVPTPTPPLVPNQSDQLFTSEGTLNRKRFTADAARLLVATTGESHSVGDTKISVFHLVISLTRGGYLAQFFSSLRGGNSKDVEMQLKMLRARVRQAYRRPVVEEKLIVRPLYDTDLDAALRTLLDMAARLARQGVIEERHLISALLADVPVELRPVLQESGVTTANLQKYNQEKGR